ncbi:MAG: hypothetical protein WB680_13780 [Candidatus Acidiferrales bacterium]
MSEHVENGKFAAATRRALSALATLALVLAGAAAARAQSASSSAAVQSAKSAAPSAASAGATAKAATNPTAASAPSGGLNTGIQIHGHWKIVVRNPDGTVATRREFENSLTYPGAYLLQNFLGGTLTPGAWAIGLGAQLPGDTGPCTNSFTITNSQTPSPVSSGSCIIAEPTGQYLNGSVCAGNAPACQPNLTRQQRTFQTTTQSLNGPLGTVLVSRVVSSSGFELTGTAAASSSGTIDTVATLVMECAPIGTSYAADPNGNYNLPPLSSVSSTSPATCTNPGYDPQSPSQIAFNNYKWGTPFSATVLNGSSATSTPPSAVQVVANQTIQVSVVFTFN